VKTQLAFKAGRNKVTPLIFLAVVISFPVRLFSQPAFIVSSFEMFTDPSPSADQDPNRPASELNHHLAGCALIAIGMLVIAGRTSRRLRPLQYVWPFLFVAAGLFLAAWSDKEMWPRGNLNWAWLIHHDAEARQHKIYAVLLIVMGMMEYLRVRGMLSAFWRTWTFPMLALVGVVLLLFHDHTGGSDATSPEARNYLVSWSVDRTTKTPASVSPSPSDLLHHDHSMMHASGRVEGPAHSETTAPEGVDSHNGGKHLMNAAMVKVEHQHLWFALVGLAVVLFKVVHDGEMWRRSFVPFLWPSCIAVLGMLLVLYTE
jgi:hypothetical protein